MKFETSRRGFLGSAAGAMLLSNAGMRLSAAATGSAWPFRLGLATYSLRDFDRATAIRMIRQMPVKTVSVKDVHLKLTLSAAEIAAARKEFEDAGITIVSGGNISLQKPEQIKQAFEYAKQAGMGTIVCAPAHETLDAVEAAIKEYNIKAAIHNHGPEDKHFPTPQSVLEAVKGRDKRFGLCMDIGHTARTGVDVVKSIAEAGPRLLDMHCKDLKSFTNKGSQVACGDGVMPFPAIFRQLKKINYTGNVNLEYEIDSKDPMMGIQRSFSYMLGVLAGLKG